MKPRIAREPSAFVEALPRARHRRARGGVKVGERGKVYALAGYTNARYKTSYTTPAGVTTRDAANLDGFRLGAGYEHNLTSNVYGKVEYRYSDYESDISRHQVLFGVGLNF